MNEKIKQLGLEKYIAKKHMDKIDYIAIELDGRVYIELKRGYNNGNDGIAILNNRSELRADLNDVEEGLAQCHREELEREEESDAQPITKKDFFETLTSGNAVMIEHAAVEKDAEEKTEKAILKFANNDDKVASALNEIPLTRYKATSYGARSARGSELRHSKENAYFRLHENVIMVTLDWSHCTVYMVYLVKGEN